jgi:hypothetical protein
MPHPVYAENLGINRVTTYQWHTYKCYRSLNWKLNVEIERVSSCYNSLQSPFRKLKSETCGSEQLLCREGCFHFFAGVLKFLIRYLNVVFQCCGMVITVVSRELSVKMESDRDANSLRLQLHTYIFFSDFKILYKICQLVTWKRKLSLVF